MKVRVWRTPTDTVDGIDLAELHELRGRDRDKSADGDFSGFSVQP